MQLVNANFVILMYISLNIYQKCRKVRKTKKVRNNADFSQQCRITPLHFDRCNCKSAMLVGRAIKINSSIDSTNVLVANLKPLRPKQLFMAASNQTHYFLWQFKGAKPTTNVAIHNAQCSGFKFVATGTFVLSILDLDRSMACYLIQERKCISSMMLSPHQARVFARLSHWQLLFIFMR